MALSEWLAEHGVHARGDGGDRRVLEAGLARARGQLRTRARQRSARPNVPGARPTSTTRCGSPTCSRTGSSAAASCHRRRSKSCGADPDAQAARARARITRSRVDKMLQDANIKLGSVLTDILGQSGRAILDAIIAGETDPAKLVLLVGKHVKASRQAIVEALLGKVTAHHRFLLKLHLGQVDALQAAIDEIDREVGERLESFRASAESLIPIPGSVRSSPRRSSPRSASTCRASRPPDISSPGPGCARATTRAPASVARRECARARPGSRPSSSRAPGARPAPRTPTSKPSFSAYGPDAVPRKPSWPSPPRSSPPSTTCSRPHRLPRPRAQPLQRRNKTKSINRLLRRIETLGFEVTRIRESSPPDHAP